MLRAMVRRRRRRRIKKQKKPYKVIENRVEAIKFAIANAKKNDIIILAGKGHETYQEINGVKYHLGEREEVAAHLQELRNQNG